MNNNHYLIKLYLFVLFSVLMGVLMSSTSEYLKEKRWAYLNLTSSSSSNSKPTVDNNNNSLMPTTTTDTDPTSGISKELLAAAAAKKSIILADSALYGTLSPRETVSGQLIAVKSRSIPKFKSSNKNEYSSSQQQLQQQQRRPGVDSKGCNDYLNKNLPEKFVALVSRGDCSFDRKIYVALRNNASAIIIHNNDQDVFTMYTYTSRLD